MALAPFQTWHLNLSNQEKFNRVCLMPRASSSDLSAPEDKLPQGMHIVQGQIRLIFQELQDTIYNGQFHCFVVVCWVLVFFFSSFFFKREDKDH